MIYILLGLSLGIDFRDEIFTSTDMDMDSVSDDYRVLGQHVDNPCKHVL